MPRKRYKEFCWRCQVLPDSEDAILLSYLQNHPFFSLKETILPLIKARWLLAALRNSGSHSSTDLEYLRRESINFLLRQIDEVCRDVGFNCTELGAIAPGISSGLIPIDLSQKEMVDRSLLKYNGILPQKYEPTPRIY
jgi:hypothetical protein